MSGVIIQMWNGIALQITEPMVMLIPRCAYDNHPDNCCGAGEGVWEKVVPDYIYVPPSVIRGTKPTKIKISPACRIHDLDWEFSSPSWDDFHASNSRLYANIKAIVEKQTVPKSRTQYYALRYPAIYAHAVDTAGRKLFWRLKKDQGHKIPASAAWLVT